MDRSPPLSCQCRDKTATVHSVCACGLKRERKCWVVRIFSLHDCPNTVSFPASLSPLPSLSSLPFSQSLCFFFLSFFSKTCLSPLRESVPSCVTFLLIYSFSCNRKHSRYSLISGQSYQPLFSELGLIAGMIITHRMGSWAPECHLWRWSQLCCPKPLLQI